MTTTNTLQTQPQSFNPHEHMMKLKSKEGEKDYLPVQWRLVWFRELCPLGTIDTQEMDVDLDRVIEVEAFAWNAEKRRSEKIVKSAQGYARFRATVTDGKGGSATGHGSECAADFVDYIEKAETKAIGRALAALGYGTQFAGEFNEEHRIVDAPVPSAERHEPTTVEGREEHTITRAQKTASLIPQPLAKAVPPTAPVAPTLLRPIAQQPREHTSPAPVIEEADVARVYPVTEQQRATISKLCSHIGKAEPPLLTALSFEQAKALITELSQEYRATRRQGTDVNAPPAVPLSPSVAKTRATISVVPLDTPSSSASLMASAVAVVAPMDATARDHKLRACEDVLGPYAFAHVVLAEAQVTTPRAEWTEAQVDSILVKARNWNGSTKHKEWNASVPLESQVAECKQLAATFGPINMNRLVTRLVRKPSYSECTRGEMDRVLLHLRTHLFTCRLAHVVDRTTDPTTKKSVYTILAGMELSGVTHPLDLINRGDGGDLEVYQGMLVDTAKGKTLPEGFIAKYGAELARLQAAAVSVA